jgi:hypothetical protein
MAARCSAATLGGPVYVRNLDTGQRLLAWRSTEPIAWIAFSANSSELAIVAGNEVTIRALPDAGSLVTEEVLEASHVLPRVELVRPEFVVYSLDNRWMAITGDHGAVWLYRRTDAQWRFLSVGNERVTRGLFTADSKRLFVKDAGGKAHIIDMTAPMFQ